MRANIGRIRQVTTEMGVTADLKRGAEGDEDEAEEYYYEEVEVEVPEDADESTIDAALAAKSRSIPRDEVASDGNTVSSSSSSMKRKPKFCKGEGWNIPLGHIGTSRNWTDSPDHFLPATVESNKTSAICGKRLICIVPRTYPYTTQIVDISACVSANPRCACASMSRH